MKARKRGRRGLAFLLAFALVFTTFVSDLSVVNAQENANTESSEGEASKETADKPEKEEKKQEPEKKETPKKEENKADDKKPAKETKPEEPEKAEETKKDSEPAKAETEVKDNGSESADAKTDENKAEEPKAESPSKEEAKEDNKDDAKEKAEKYTVRFKVNNSDAGVITVAGSSVNAASYKKDVEEGKDFKFSVTAKEGFDVESVKTENVDVAKNGAVKDGYIVKEIKKNTEIAVQYKEVPKEDTEKTPEGEEEAPEGEEKVPEETEEVPETVKAFLDAVAALPSADQVTKENAEEVGGQVNAALDMWEALDEKFAEREDVRAALEKVYAVYESVLKAEGIEDAETYGSGYIPVADVTINPDKQPSGTTAVGKVRDSGQSLEMKVGQKASFLLGAPTNTLMCPSHRYVFASYTPSDYCNISLIDNSGKNLVGNPTYKAGINDGERVFDTIFEALKPGVSSDVRVCYHCNFGIVFSNGAISGNLYCPYGCGHYVTAYEDRKWYRYNDVFGIKVNADYVLHYDTQGGNTLEPERKTAASTQATFSPLKNPSRDGYTFEGWYYDKDGKNPVGESVTLNWSEGLGSASNPVSMTIYAKWKENDSKAPDAPKRDDLHGILKVSQFVGL